jgi:large subunit ribosomal protein L18
MFKRVDTRGARKKRHMRVRKRVSGTSERPRLSVFRSLNHMYGQIIDDRTGRTLAWASTVDPALREELKGTKTERARRVGEVLAKRAVEAGITRVVFDRGGFLYHGRVRALADGARSGGLDF